MNNERLIEVKLPKCTVFLTASEINQLLKHDTGIYSTALQRGKRILRARKQKVRERNLNLMY